MGVAQPAALSMIAKSDFVILTALPKAGIYPFYLQIARYWGELKNWADANMMVARQVPFDNFTATIYIRPTGTISGLSGDSVTDRGTVDRGAATPTRASSRDPALSIRELFVAAKGTDGFVND